MYISEMSPPNMRGKFVSVNQLMIMIGILAAQTVIGGFPCWTLKCRERHC